MLQLQMDRGAMPGRYKTIYHLSNIVMALEGFHCANDHMGESANHAAVMTLAAWWIPSSRPHSAFHHGTASAGMVEGGAVRHRGSFHQAGNVQSAAGLGLHLVAFA